VPFVVSPLFFFSRQPPAVSRQGENLDAKAQSRKEIQQ
jgi:hypothetical protein